MDQAMFDRLARSIGSVGSRRSALAVLGGVGFVGASRAATARSRNRKQRNRKERVSAQAADCFSPGPGSNLNGCDFTGAILQAMDLSGSTMVGAKFNEANLCGADLSSSQLRNARFNGAFLFRTDFSGSGCRNVRFDADTFFCLTKTCNGVIRNDDCPPIDLSGFCCGDDDCPDGTVCCLPEDRIDVGNCSASCVVAR
jgi:hypothetical protein